MKFQPHCKICKSDYAKPLLYLYHCEHLTYKQLIERYKGHLDINIFNLSCHFQRHVEQSDVEEVEQTKLRWEEMRQEA